MKILMTYLPVRLAPALLIIAAVCTPNASNAADRETVFVSIAPQKFLVERLAGDAVRVHVLLPSGASPATYEPTPKQMAALSAASLFLQIGAPFEAPLLGKISSLMPDLHMVDCRSGVELEPMDDHAHAHGDAFFDPHIWLDPLRMKVVASTTADALAVLLPEAGQEIKQNLQGLLSAIDQTHEQVARSSNRLRVRASWFSTPPSATSRGATGCTRSQSKTRARRHRPGGSRRSSARLTTERSQPYSSNPSFRHRRRNASPMHWGARW